MNVRELITTWGFDIDDKPLKELDEKVDKVKENLKHLFEVIAAEAATLFGLAAHTSSVAREASRLAQITGTTTQEIQRLQYAAKVTGGSAEGLSMALRRLSVSAKDASMGGAESNLAFSQAGISIYDSTGKLKNASILMKEMAATFKTMPDGPEKTALAIRLMGRGGAELIPMLNRNLKELGDQGERVGAVMSKVEIENGKKFGERFNEIKAIFEGVLDTLGNKLIPVFIELMDNLKAWYYANKAIIDQDINEFIMAMVDSLRFAWAFSKFLFDAVKTLTGGFGALSTVLVIVVGLFAAFSTANTINAMLSMLPIIWKVVAALQAVIAGEAMATGGLSLLVSAGAGIAAMAGTAYLLSGSGGGSRSLDNTLAVNGAYKQSGPISNTSNSKTLVQNIRSNFSISAAPGTSAQQAEHISKLVATHLDQVHRNAAQSAATVVDR